MGIRTGRNAPLGCPAFGKAFDDSQTIRPGTIIEGFDDVNNVVDEYIWLKAGVAHAVGDDVTYNAAYTTAAAAANAGQADAIVATGANQYAWFKLKPRAAAA